MFTEEQKIKQLLIPRYKIMQKYPNPIGKVGDIFYDDTAYYDEFPQIFYKLKWWQLRQKEEMPEYVRYERYNVWFVDKLILHSSLEEPFPFFTTPTHTQALYYNNVDAYPATKEDYDHFQNTPQLLIPRYLVLKDYPGSVCRVNEILTNPPSQEYYNKYPEYFQKLDWYEERSSDIMPKYLIDTTTKEIKKVLKYHEKFKKRMYLTSAVPNTKDDWFTLSNQWEPATEQQFLEQKAFYENNNRIS